MRIKINSWLGKIKNCSQKVFFVLVVHISPCVVSVTAAAAADFPGFPKPYTAANLETKPSDHHISQRHTNTLPQSIFPLVLQARGHGDAGGQALINDPADNDGVEASLTRLLPIPTNTGMKMKLHVLHVQ